MLGTAAAATCVAAAAWWGAGAAAQEPPVRGAKVSETVTVLDTGGDTHTITQVQLHSEEVGLLSVSLEPADEFTFSSGKATLSIPVRSILEIQFSEAKDGEWTKVKVIDIDKRSVEGAPVATKVNELRGKGTGSKFTAWKSKMADVQKITFNWTPSARTCVKCKRSFTDSEWTHCPYDGKSLQGPAGKK
jgi:hypothetical protein